MLSWWLALLTCVLPARAHPFASSLYGHRTAVWLDSDQVEVVYVAEVPTVDLLVELRAFLADVPDPGATDQERFDEAKHQELASGLRLIVDGAPTPLTLLPPQADDGRGDSRFITYRLSLEAALAPGARTVQLVNTNRPDRPAMYMSELFVSDRLVVDASNLYEVAGDEVRHDLAGSWRADESLREVRVSFRHRGERTAALGRWLRARFGDAEPWRTGRSALSTEARPVDASLATGEVPAALLAALGATLAALVGGAALAWARRRRKA